MRKSGACLFVGGLAVDDDRIIFLRDGFAAVPYFFHEGAGGIIFFHGDPLVAQLPFDLQRGAESGDHHDIVGLQAGDGDQFLSIRVLQKFDPVRQQVGIHLRVMDHFAEQVDPFAGVFLHRAEGDLDRVLHAIAKPEMPGEEDLQGAHVEPGGTEIFFHPVRLFPFFLDRGDQGAAVNDGDVEAFHLAKIVGRRLEVGGRRFEV